MGDNTSLSFSFPFYLLLRTSFLKQQNSADSADGCTSPSSGCCKVHVLSGKPSCHWQFHVFQRHVFSSSAIVRTLLYFPWTERTFNAMASFQVIVNLQLQLEPSCTCIQISLAGYFMKYKKYEKCQRLKSARVKFLSEILKMSIKLFSALWHEGT